MTPRIERIYLDSGVLIGSVVESVNHAAACKQCCQELVEQKTMVVTSTPSRYETAHVAALLGNPAGRRSLPNEVIDEYNLTDWSTDVEVRDRWMTTVTASLDELLASFDSLAESPVFPHLWHAASRLMVEHDLQSFDALHLATATSLGILDFATTDRQFLNIDGLNVHLTRDS